MFANFTSNLMDSLFGMATSCLLLLAEGDPAGAAAQPEITPLQKLLPWGLPLGLFFIFYMTMIAPEKRRQREEADLLKAIGKNDRVITVGGIHGTVVSINDGVVTLKVDESGNAKIKVNQTAIATRIDPNKEKEASKTKD